MNHNVRRQGITTASAVLALTFLQIAVGVGLFWWYRVLDHGETSDLLVLYSPVIGAVVAHTSLFLRMRRPRINSAKAFGIACAIALLGGLITFVIFANVWGT